MNEVKRKIGVINCCYFPRDVGNKPAHYTTISTTFSHVDGLLRKVVARIPEEYQENFQMREYWSGGFFILGRTSQLRGPVRYSNYIRYDSRSPKKLRISLDIVDKESCKTRGGWLEIYGPRTSVCFSFAEREKAALILNAFDKEFEPCIDEDMNPLIELFDIDTRKFVKRGYQAFVAVYDGLDVPVLNSPHKICYDDLPF